MIRLRAVKIKHENVKAKQNTQIGPVGTDTTGPVTFLRAFDPY